MARFLLVAFSMCLLVLTIFAQDGSYGDEDVLDESDPEARQIIRRVTRQRTVGGYGGLGYGGYGGIGYGGYGGYGGLGYGGLGYGGLGYGGLGGFGMGGLGLGGFFDEDKEEKGGKIIKDEDVEDVMTKDGTNVRVIRVPEHVIRSILRRDNHRRHSAAW